ncbi:MAG TPA: cytochrome c oxidase subunit 3 [Pyrinomonadaceae bacterium]|jgi:cytochrome c oxidase subunit 3
MAVTVTGTREKTVAHPQRKTGGGGGGNGSRKPNGRGGGGPGGGGRGGGGRRESDAAERYRIGMWVALASIVMLFTALTSAYIVRSGISNDWRPLALPPFLWVSTALIVASSLLIETGRRKARSGDIKAARTRLFLTLLLGLGFIASQLLVWRQLVAEGVYLKSNPHSSFFYVLTGLHGLHVLGGIVGLNYLLLRARRETGGTEAERNRLSAIDSVTLYWHFMDGLWIYLLVLLFLWR